MLAIKKKCWLTVIILVSAIFMIILVACQPSNSEAPLDLKGNPKEEDQADNSGASVVINMAMFNTDPNGMMEELRQKFNEEHDNVELKYIEMSNDASQMHDQTVTQLAGKSANLDIVNMDVVWTAEFAEAGWLLPLDDRFSDEHQEEFVERQVDTVTYDGHVWAVPWFNDLHPLWYRKDLLEKYGYDVPETYEDAVKIAEDIQEQEGIQGFSMHWGRSEQLIVSFVEFLHANNADFYDEKGQVVIDSPEAVEALQFMVDMVYEHEVVPQSNIGYTTPEDSRIPFTEGQALFNPNWGYVYAENQSEGSAVKDLTWLTSGFSFKGGQRASAVGGWNFGISKYSAHPDEAWQVIDWFTSFDSQKLMTVGGGYVGAHVDLYKDDDILGKFPQLEEYLKVFNDASNRPSQPNYAKLSDIAQSYVHQALTKETSPQEALEGLAAELRSME